MKYKLGDIVEGEVTGIQPYGAFIKLDDEVNGLLHISEISNKYVRNIEFFLHVGDKVRVKIIEIDEENNRTKLSLKAARQKHFINKRKMPLQRGTLPESIIGFSSIQAKLEEWIKEAESEEKMHVNLDEIHALLKDNIDNYQEEVSTIHKMIKDKTGQGNDYLGWVDWAINYDVEEVNRIKELANEWKDKFDVLLVCGIGGSYLGARAAIEMMKGLYPNDNKEVIFIGNTFSSTYTKQVIDHLKGKQVILNVISKSGTTTETAIAFRLLKQYMEDTYGKQEAVRRIFATTDKARGTLKQLSDQEGYQTFVIPDDIGGRYSVITSVGLLPMALMGIDIDSVLQGYKDATNDLSDDSLFSNTAYRYAVARRILQKQGYNVEMFVTYEPQLNMLAEWWKQLLGESEGKDGLGILPVSATFSTDLHSLGQFIQDGRKVLFETVLTVKEPLEDINVPFVEGNLDGMNYLADKKLSWVNEKAFEGTLQAHEKTGNVPNLIIEIKDLKPYTFGYLVYWFFMATAMTCYMLGINPFNQPGVEVYKKNMFKLLGKPE